MELTEILLISVSLAMDAFAVSVCKGLCMKNMNWKKAFIIGGYFGMFQMCMPIIGYLLGIGFSDLVKNINHWIAFILLGFIGIKMIYEAFEKEEAVNDKVDFKTMFVLGVATSLDALTVGITYACLDTANCWLAFTMIGIITFIMSVFGVKIGSKFGYKYGNKAEILGGMILVFLGIKILLEHLNII